MIDGRCFKLGMVCVDGGVAAKFVMPVKQYATISKLQAITHVNFNSSNELMAFMILSILIVFVIFKNPEAKLFEKNYFFPGFFNSRLD